MTVTTTVITTKTFCSQTDYYADKAFNDSILAFKLRYNTDSTVVDVRDSIYKYETVKNIKCGETATYINSGYDCNCAK